MRLERMRGFGATPGQLATCACALLTLEDGSPAILITSLAGAPKPPPLAARLQFMLDGLDRPAVALSPHGALLGTNSAARLEVSHFEQFAHADFVTARDNALRDGHAELMLDTPFQLYRVGGGHDAAVVVLMPAREPLVSNATGPDEALDESFADEVLVDEDETVEETAAIASENPPPREPQAASVPVAGDLTSSAPPGSEPLAVAGEMTPADAMPARHPLRFIWQMDAETRFSLGSDEFSKLIGPLAAAALGRPWREIADHFGIDPEGKIAKAVASGETWSGVVIDWPLSDGGDRIPIEMSGLPMFDRARNLAGYRGFGICRDLAGLEQLADMRRQETQFGIVHPSPATAIKVAPEQSSSEGAPEQRPTASLTQETINETIENAPAENVLADIPPAANANTANAGAEASAAASEASAPPQNVVPFPLAGDPRTPALSAVENHAFDEIARRLSARLDQDVRDAAGEHTEPHHAGEQAADNHTGRTDRTAAPGPWLGDTVATRGESTQDKPLIERMPVGVLIYRLDHLLYANPAFLERTGFASLHALSDAGGLDALYVQPVESSASSSSENGMPLSIATGDASRPPILARLYSITWDDEPAMALIFAADAPTTTEPALPPQRIAEASIPPQPSAAVNDDLASIIEAMADGIVMFDQEGNILSCNRSAEALFNEGTAQLTQRNLADLFAPESQPVVLAYFEGLDNPATTRAVDHGREVLGQVRGGGLIPLAMTMGRTADRRYFAVFRDLSQLRKNEAELLSARRSAERAASLRSDVLARINHEIRVPLNAIIGFAEAMIEQRFGPLGAERYLDYMRDIRAAGERVLTIVSDMLNLTRIETGKLELAPVSVNLNDVVAQCVGVLQPQANRERIIIRSSLAPHLPVVFADAQSLRQIVSSLLASSIELANAGGQVIISTALTDRGEVSLRVRDTGRPLSERDIRAAVEPYRASAGDDHVVPDTAGINLALTKALVEANRAQLTIRNAPQAGTLIEVVFPLAAQAAAGG
jgi:PAS domain S-box-containing protein